MVFAVSLSMPVVVVTGASEAAGVIGRLEFAGAAVAGRTAGVAAASAIAKCSVSNYSYNAHMQHKIISLGLIL